MDLKIPSTGVLCMYCCASRLLLYCTSNIEHCTLNTGKIPKHCTDAEDNKANVSKSRKSCGDKTEKREIEKR